MMWVTILATFAGIILYASLSMRHDRQRSAALQTIATSLGATFRAAATAEDNALLTQTHLGSLGQNRRTTNIIESARTDDLSVTLFDYIYETGFGKYAQDTHQAVMRIQSPRLSLPKFLLYPESFFTKVAQSFGYIDFNFPEFPEFSKMYGLRGMDEAAIRHVFTPELIQFCREHPEINLEAYGNGFLLYRFETVKPEAIAAFLEQGKRITALIFAAVPPAA
ncbi:MAG: hypothetical protein QOF24_1799 [Verrucomicrobiota bacterium]